MTYKNMNTIEVLVRRYVSVTCHCWNWTGKIGGNGYGHARLEGRFVLAHRGFFSKFVGPIPDGYQVDHLCENKRCVNPDHLEAVTPRDNTLRSSRAPATKNAAKTHCERAGHPLSGDNLYIEPRGSRSCRACRAEQTAAYQLRKKEASIGHGS